MGKRIPLEERFWTKVNKTEGCWLWARALDTRGYGHIRDKGLSKRAHRVAWELSNGLVPVGMQVCHTCDVRHCVNPDHLFLGTSHENIRDAVDKGRFQHGETSGSAKLRESDITDVFILNAAGWSQAKIGARLGVSGSTIGSILRGEKWSYLWR